jgi:hypothetical protein
MLAILATLRKQRSEGSWFQTSPGKKFTRPQLNRKKPGVVVYSSNSTMLKRRGSWPKLARAKRKTLFPK